MGRGAFRERRKRRRGKKRGSEGWNQMAIFDVPRASIVITPANGLNAIELRPSKYTVTFDNKVFTSKKTVTIVAEV